MSKNKLIFSFIIVFSFVFSVFAQEEKDQSLTLNKKTLTTSSLMSASEANHAKQWKLSLKEYSRYKEILRSPRAYFTPNLDKNPLLALALESESNIDRQRYADKWVQIQFENNVKVIGWQFEVSKAWARAFPGVPRFSYKQPETSHHAIANMGKMPPENDIFNTSPNQRSLEDMIKPKPRAQLYISVDDCNECSASFNRQYAELQSGALSGIDLHFVGGSSTKDKIIQWAIDNKLNANDVNDKRVITLNVAEKSVSKVPLLEFN